MAGQPVYVHFNSDTEKNVEIVIMDMQGRIVYRKKITLAKGSQVVTIGSLKAGNGTYILRVTGFAAQAESKKIMVPGN